MYGRFLLPFYEAKKSMKFLEIGLGCDMGYGPGASVKVWKKLFPEAEMWEAELNKACVEKAKAAGQLEGIHVLVGDQGDPNVLDQWVAESKGGNFDVIIDDGGHSNFQIKLTFEKFWPLLNDGGLYFIEDMHVGKVPGYQPRAGPVMSDVMQDWMEQLVHAGVSEDMQQMRPIQYPLPQDVAFVTCLRHACVIGKLVKMERGFDLNKASY